IMKTMSSTKEQDFDKKLKAFKKKLSDRMFKLTDGSRVQRDLYSSFLLYNIDLTARTIDRAKCIESFNDFLLKQQDLIAYIKVNKINVANSGIKL
ncbi:MAG: hypothetical protein SPG96_00160, partial [Succinivibrio sp.]|nr:hypothetical protein [Succinivibrio sp.]